MFDLLVGNGRCCKRSDEWVMCSVAWDLGFVFIIGIWGFLVVAGVNLLHVLGLCLDLLI